jgi:ATP synthase protein I
MKINFNLKEIISGFAKYSNSTNIVFELGAALVGNILVGVFIGLWLGNLYSNRALLVIIFMLLGLASGFYQVWKLSLRELRRIEESSKKNIKNLNDSGGDSGSSGSNNST